MTTEDGQNSELARRLSAVEQEVRHLQQRVAGLERESKARPADAVTDAASSETVAPPPSPEEQKTPAPVPPPLPRPKIPVPPPLVGAPVVRRPSALGEFMRAVHLLPPEDESRGEVQLGWWATRVGALLFVLGVVFFGIYLSLDTTPLVKLIELAAASLGVALGGWWLERKVPRVGAVVLGAGLALIFFTTFAAYAIPAVKIFDSIGLAAVTQAVVIVGIYAIAIRRRSATVATMATGLGFFAAWFSHIAGFDDFALGASLILLAAAAVFRRQQRWPGPLAVAVVVHHAMLAWIALAIWNHAPEAVNQVMAFGVLAAGFALGFGALVWEGAERDGLVATAQRWIQVVNTTCASFAGFAVAVVLLSEIGVGRYFFAAGAVLALAAWWVWRSAPRDTLFTMLVVQASALVALGAATEWGERTRWIALVIEAFILLAAARRTRRVSLHVTAVAVWLVALAFFAGDLGRLSAAPFSVDGGAIGFFVVAGAVLLGLVRRWIEMDSKANGRAVTIVLGIAGAVAVWLAGEHVHHDVWAPAALTIVAVMLVGAAVLSGNRVAFPGVAVAFVLAHLTLQFVQGTSTSLPHAVGNGLVVAFATAVGMWWMGGRIAADGSRRHPLLPLVVGALGVAALFPAAYLFAPWREGLALTLLLATAVGWAGLLSKNSPVVGSAVLALGLAVLLLWWYRTGSLVDSVGGSLAWMWIASLSAPLMLVILAWAGEVRDDLEGQRLFRPLGWLVALVGLAVGVGAASSAWEGTGVVWSMIGFSAVFAVIGVTLQVGAGLVGASGFLGLAAAGITLIGGWPEAGAGSGALFAGAAAVIALALLPLMVAQRAQWIERSTLIPWRTAHAMAAAGVAISLAVEPRVLWSAYGSVAWAVGGIVIFSLGLLYRARSHRIVGLVTLALCIPRVFLVDLDSTSHRIAAFVVLGAVLLSVGFSYQRFRHLIADDTPVEPPPTSS